MPLSTTPDSNWPTPDFSRVPFEVFTSTDHYAREQSRIFRGPVWNYLCMEIEIPNSGDFIRTWVGDLSVVVSRAEDGSIHAFENSCAHRGAQLTSKLRGNTRRHTCAYHLWTYSLKGELVGVPLEKGVNGKGGMPPHFDKRNHSLNTLRVTTFGGLVFGTLSDDTPDIETYLGPHAVSQIQRLLVQRKPKVLGY
ncbi:MAG: Rieske 2Fe-2S domain-containing protein, partial [Betaproteobacteria bacterium]